MEISPWLTLVFSSVVASLGYFFVKLYLHRRFYRDVPTPPHSFLWGHLKLMGEPTSLLPSGAHYQQAITTIAQKYDLPGAWYLDLWPAGPSQLIVTDPDLANQFTVIKNHPKHVVATEVMDRVLGTGNIFTAEGPAWKAAHNMIAPAFSVSHQKTLVGMMAEEVMVFRSILKELAATGEVFELERVLHNLVLNTVARSMFEESLNAQRRETPMLTKFHAVCKESVYHMQSWNPIGRFFARRRLQGLNRELEAQLADMIRGRYEKLLRDNADVSQKRGLCTTDLILRDRLLVAGKDQEKALDPAFMHMAASQGKQYSTTPMQSFFLT